MGVEPMWEKQKGWTGTDSEGHGERHSAASETKRARDEEVQRENETAREDRRRDGRADGG